MSVMTEKTVRDLVVKNPAAARTLEKFGIDYCCGGQQSLEEACRAANAETETVLDALRAQDEAGRAAKAERDWTREPLAELITHMVATHHKFVREEIARLDPLFAQVCSVHGENHPELLEMREVFGSLAQELTMHLMKEEKVLFPCIARMEEAVAAKETVLPAPFGSVQNPVYMMEHEHESAGHALRALRAASHGYTAPADACLSYQSLYRGLAEFEADLHQHIHLENNILFPRAVAMEAGRG